MALVAWYKLNGNVLDSTVNGNHGTIVGSPTVVNDGPFGTCYLFNPDTNDRINISNLSQFIYNTPFTFSAWIKTTGLGTSQTVNGIITLTYGTRFCCNSAGNIYISFISTNIGSYSITSSEVNINDNTWHHVCCTYNGDVLKLYIDGSLNVTSITGIIQTNTYTNNGAIGLDVNDSSKYKFNGSISDVRIYDEALSLKEIKELAKAKVLHYDFNQYQEPTENLLDFNSVGFNVWPSSNSNMHSLTTKISANSFTVKGTSTVPGAYSYIYPFIPVAIDKIYTLSATFKNNLDVSVQCKLAIREASNGTYLSNNEIFTIPAKSTIRGYITSTIKNVALTVTTSLTIFSDSTSGLVDTEIYDVQLEQKDHATPFVNGTRTAQVYDKSGYNNNAELAVSTTPTYVNDSIVNKGCYEFDGTQYMTPDSSIMDILIKNSFTLSFWLYSNDVTNITADVFGGGNYGHSTGGIALSHHSSNSWYLDMYLVTTGRISTTIGHSYLPFNQWNLITITRDRSNTDFKVYINGLLFNEKLSIPNENINWNKTSYPLKIGKGYYAGTQGKIADFRIYSTALSADDIKEIYQTRASIDKNGNLYCNNIEENKYINPIVDYTSWVVGTSGVQTGFDLNGATSENYIIESSDPFNNIIPIWEARTDGVYGPSGGWVTSSFNIDNTKLYRFSVWVRRTTIGNGSFYLGVYGYGSTSGVYTLANVNNTNPYFYYSSNLFTNRQDQWLLVVGYVYPYTYTGTTSPADSGVYNVDGTKIVASTTSFKWRPETTTAKHRSYLFYSTDIDTRQQWCYPRVDICDGTEPTIVDLLNGTDYKHYQITKDLISSKGINKNSSILSNEFSEVGITEGLVAYYPLNGDAKDYSGNNNHGTVYGATMATGINGKKCYYFDGTDDSILVDDNPNISFSGEQKYSLCAWVYPIAGGVTWYGVMSKGNANSYAININSPSWYLQYEIYGSLTTRAFNTANSAITPDAWNHIVVLWDGSYKRIYINGIEVTSITDSDLGTYANTEALRIGLGNNGEYLKGKIQDVRIYNRALSDKEIEILYNLFNPNINKTLQINKENIIYTKGNIKEV